MSKVKIPFNVMKCADDHDWVYADKIRVYNDSDWITENNKSKSIQQKYMNDYHNGVMNGGKCSHCNSYGHVGHNCGNGHVFQPASCWTKAAIEEGFMLSTYLIQNLMAVMIFVMVEISGFNLVIK